MPKIKMYVWLAIVLVVVLCTPAEAKDIPVSSASGLHCYCSHLFLRSFVRSFFRSFLLTECKIFVGLAQEEWFSVYLRGFGHVHLSSLCLFDEISSFVLNLILPGFPYNILDPKP